MNFLKLFQSNKTSNFIDNKIITTIGIGQFVTLLALFNHIPIWIFILFLFCVLWKYKISQLQISYPNNNIKIIVILLILFGIKQHVNDFKTLNSFAILLSSMFILKLWEASNERDIFTLSYTGILCANLILLFDNSILFTFYSLLCVFLFISSICLLYTKNLNFAFKKIGIIIAQALPLAIFLFLVIPRIESLWSLPTSQDNIQSGLNDEITFNNMQKLALSDHLAFRVEFKNKIPENKYLYFKGFTLNFFDGEKWKNTENRSISDELIELSDDVIEYSILMEPTGQRYLYALSFPQAIDPNIFINSDGSVFSRKILSSPFQYSIKSHLNTKIDRNLDSIWLNKYLQLPQNNNEKSKYFANEIFKKSYSVDDFITKIVSNFQNNGFKYSLNIDSVNKNSFDHFMFKSKMGFCAHYAGATAFMLRSVGIPTRVVIGYQGGTVNDDYLRVSSKDAHAWVEYWLEDKGWIMIDPTAYVAPERILSGMEEFQRNDKTTTSQGSRNLKQMFNFTFLTQFSLFIDKMNFQWQKFVISYDEKEQQSLFLKIFQDLNLTKISIILITILFSIIALMWVIIEKPFRKRSQLEKIYNLIYKKAKKANIKIEENYTIEQISNKLQKNFPNKKKQLDNIILKFNLVFYNNQINLLKPLKKQIKKIFQ